MQSEPGNVKSPKYRTICPFVHRPRACGPRDCHESPGETISRTPNSVPRAASSTSPRGVLHRSGPAWTGPFRRPSPGGAPCAEYLGRNVAAAPLRRFFGNGSSGRPDRAGSGARPDRGPRIRSEGGWRRRIGAGTRFVVACFRDGCPRSTAWGRDPRAGNTPPETFGKSGSSTVSGNDDTMQHAHRGTRPNVP